MRNPALPIRGFAFARIGELHIGRGDTRRAQAMAHPVAKEFLARANSLLLLGLICGGLGVCVFGAIAFDLSRWFAQ
jgi:hypothetical protein